TGHAAFNGENVTEIISRILQRDPDLTMLPPNVPRRIHELLRLCLQKDVRKRRSDAADVRIDLELALAEPSEIPASATNLSSRRGRLAWLMAAVFLMATLMVAVAYFRETPPTSMTCCSGGGNACSLHSTCCT